MDDSPEPDSGRDAEPDQSGYQLVCPFWIDTDAYTSRDQFMFCCGFEFAGIVEHLMDDPDPLQKTIHRENESRVRMACGRFKRRCSIEPCESEHDPDGNWSYLTIEAT